MRAVTCWRRLKALLFFWLGDTAWELIHSTTREECSYYLQTRAAQGFTVIQAVVLAEMDGVHKLSALGLQPFENDDPERPKQAYFQRVVEVVEEAARRGLYIALLPTWGDKLTAPWGAGPRLFRNENLPVARSYAAYLARKLQHCTNVVWMLGGIAPHVSMSAFAKPPRSTVFLRTRIGRRYGMRWQKASLPCGRRLRCFSITRKEGPSRPPYCYAMQGGFLSTVFKAATEAGEIHRRGS